MITTKICHKPIVPNFVTPVMPVVIIPKQKTYEIEKEVLRRNEIVKALSSKFLSTYQIGQKVRLGSSKDTFTIYSVCRKYTDLGKSEPWPTNDCPLIVTLFNETTERTFHATIGAVSPLN